MPRKRRDKHILYSFLRNENKENANKTGSDLTLQVILYGTIQCFCEKD